MDSQPGSDKTLQIDESASLTILKESLKIHNGPSARRQNATRTYCCGLLSTKDPGPQTINLYDLLNAQVSNNALTITYFDSNASQNAFVNALQYPLLTQQKEQAESWTNRLLESAYNQAKRCKRLKVIINAFCSSAITKYHNMVAPIFAAAHCEVDVEQTRYRGHAGEIAEKISLDAFDAIVCCSGDGLPYEVFNGLARRSDARTALSSMAVAMIPCGSGNAMSWNLFGTDDPSLATLGVVKGSVMPLDLASITQGDRHTVSFLSQALGVLADCDLTTEHLRWMGDIRFLYGVIATIARNTKYPCQLAFSPTAKETEQNMESEHTSEKSGGLSLKYGTVLDDIPKDWEIMPRERLASFYTGNMKMMAKDTNFFPDALPNDGVVDIMIIDDTVGYSGSLDAIIRLPQGKCNDINGVEMRKVSAFRLTPWKADGDISIDGERYPLEAFQVEVHQSLGRVLSKSKDSYQEMNA